MIGALKWLFGLSPDPNPAGFGQSLADDVRFFARFRRCRRRRVTWASPSRDEQLAWEAHPIVGRFGDDTIALAEMNGRRWIVRERMWCGWPDPPCYVFFAIRDDAIWCAADFDAWPKAWTRDDLRPA